MSWWRGTRSFLDVALFSVGLGQESGEFYIASLQMPCYPPLARQAGVKGVVKVKIELSKDGTVSSAVEGTIFRRASVANVQTWKFGAGSGADLSRLKTTVVFEYKIEGEPNFERRASRVVFDSFNRVEILAHPPVSNIDYSPSKRQ